jgi:hypothetical protein
MPRVGAVGLGALLVAAPCRGLGRLGEMNLAANGVQFLGDEPPTGRGLQRRLEPPAGKPCQEPAHIVAQGGRHARLS